MQRETIPWIASHILPHERDVRAWLRRSRLSRGDQDDVIQETFCRIAAIESTSHIQSGRAYFFTVARNVVLEQIRRSRVVRIIAVAEIESLNIVDNDPSPEQIAGGHQELARVQRLIEDLPRKCRQIFKMRKVDALSQREISRRLGVSESIVEKQTARGLRLILKALARDETDSSRYRNRHSSHDPTRKQHRD